MHIDKGQNLELHQVAKSDACLELNHEKQIATNLKLHWLAQVNVGVELKW